MTCSVIYIKKRRIFLVLYNFLYIFGQLLFVHRFTYVYMYNFETNQKLYAGDWALSACYCSSIIFSISIKTFSQMKNEGFWHQNYLGYVRIILRFFFRIFFCCCHHSIHVIYDKCHEAIKLTRSWFFFVLLLFCHQMSDSVWVCMRVGALVRLCVGLFSNNKQT